MISKGHSIGELAMVTSVMLSISVNLFSTFKIVVIERDLSARWAVLTNSYCAYCVPLSNNCDVYQRTNQEQIERKIPTSVMLTCNGKQSGNGKSVYIQSWT